MRLVKKHFVLPFLQVEVIFQEFYEQGDAEKAAGKTPMPMMDRTQVICQMSIFNVCESWLKLS